MVNRVILVGRIGKTPELRQFPNGGEVTSTSMATNETWKDKETEEWKEKSTWHNLSFRGFLAQRGQRLAKGDLVYIEGKNSNRDYTKEDGTKVYIHEVVVQKLTVLTKKDGYDNKEPQPQTATQTASKAAPVDGLADGDDLPF